MDTSAATRPLDAMPHSWVDRLPAALQPYARLMRLDRPIGTWLLFWPCAWSLLLAGGGSGVWQVALWLALFGLGAVVMRSAGCAYNDIVDRDIDARVARTRGRPIPSGQISVARAWAVVLGLCLVGALVLFSLPLPAILMGLGSLLLVAAYPFMKRITWWPQAWLGLTFNWGALVGWATASGDLTLAGWLPGLLLYAGGVMWTLGYDTLYALQDIEDDALAGVKSSARALGTHRVRPAIAGFYGLAVVLWAASLALVTGTVWLGALVLPVALHLAWQVAAMGQHPAPALALRLFRANHLTGGLLAVATFAAAVSIR
jgi:4-hydroxybenzoate polyprenyltransferase